MLDYLAQIYLLLTSMFLEVYVQGCNDGWFGDQCNFKCHCKSAHTCDLTTGQCPNNDQCQPGFFGPGCQYVNLVFWNAVKFNESYLWDSDDTSCNPNTSATSVTISLNGALPFSWFRIVAKQNLMNFTTSLNNGLLCSSERKFIFSKNIVDVTCDRTLYLYRLRIEGAIAPHVCSVYISGGRNVALKQEAVQTRSVDNAIMDFGDPNNAVDGDTNSNYNEQHCFSTAEQNEPPEWSVKYSRPQILYYVRVYNRDVHQHRLQNFLLITYTSENTRVAYVQDTRPNPMSIYNVIHESRAPVIRLIIRQGLNHIGPDRVLTLCEVETYGDTVCPENTYGFNCRGTCNCSTTQVCNPATGACAHGCQPGYYGFNCILRCKITCLNDVCQYISGKCLKCIPGYFGPNCDEECLPGFYGPSCKLACSKNCESTCNPATGNCICKKGFAGTNCQKCAPQYHGPDCTKKCAEFCQICDKRTGECKYCSRNRTGRGCSECLPGTYGPQCNQKCPKNCATVCSSITGNCTCKKGFTGILCTDCIKELYGDNCDKPCSRLCRGCVRATGDCKMCYGNRKGRHCQDCPPMLYGPNCENTCSSRCVNTSCNPYTGECLACYRGYEGDSCEHVTYPSLTPHLALVGCAVVLFLCLLGSISTAGMDNIVIVPDKTPSPDLFM